MKSLFVVLISRDIFQTLHNGDNVGYKGSW